MKAILAYLNGKKTYLAAFATSVYAAGVEQHLWQSSELVYALLAAATAAALRSGVKASGPAAAAAPAKE